jgi:hypothetical protein
MTSRPPTPGDEVTSVESPAAPPSRRDRAVVACLVAAVAVTLAPLTDAGGDFSQLWAGANALLGGNDPYAAVGPGRTLPWPWPLYYPVPALLIAIPFTVLPIAVARVVWVGALSGIFAFAVTAETWWGLMLCAHLTFLVAAQVGQLVVLLAVAMLIPGFGAIAAAKPTIGAAAIAGARSRRAAATMLAAALAFTVASFAFDPSWVPRWLAAVQRAPHMAPIVSRPWGWIVLVAALRWRIPAARVLTVTALVPTTLSAHDILPVLVALRAPRRETIALAALSMVAAPAQYAIADNPDRLVYSARLMPWLLWCVYVPIVVVILRRRNVGPAPAWLERLTARWPAWIRGTPAPAAA